MALAVLLVTDPDYPVPRPASPKSSASDRSVLAVRAVAPSGDCRRDSLEFSWDWQGPEIPCEVVVLSEDLEELWVSAPTRACRVLAEPSLYDHVRAGAIHYWLVRAAGASDARRSSPTLFRLRG